MCHFKDRNMKKLLFVFLTSILLFSCNKDPKTKLIGEWKEHYGVGMETDVDYTNIYKIQLTTEDDIVITCLTRNNYLFDKILFDGNELSYRKENTIDPNEIFYIYGKLKLNSNEKWLEGTVVNSRGKSSNIKWEKIK